MTASRQEDTAEFREEAVHLVISSQKSCTEFASYLVARWKQQHEQKGTGRSQFTGRGWGRSAQ